MTLILKNTIQFGKVVYAAIYSTFSPSESEWRILQVTSEYSWGTHTEDYTSRSERGAKMIFTREFGKGAEWVQESSE